MNNYKILFLFFIASFLLTCNKDNYFSEDTKNYTLKFNKVLKPNNNLTNSIKTTPLSINANRIRLKNLLAILIKVDTSAIKFENKIIGDQFYNFKIEQKNNKISVENSVFETIINHLNLKFKKQRFKSYEISIEDSVQYKKNLSKVESNFSKTIKNRDSISVENLELKKFVKVVNSEYFNKIYCNYNYKKINYKWHKSTLEDLKQNLKNDLGLMLSHTNKDTFIYTFTEKNN